MLFWMLKFKLITVDAGIATMVYSAAPVTLEELSRIFVNPLGTVGPSPMATANTRSLVSEVVTVEECRPGPIPVAEDIELTPRSKGDDASTPDKVKTRTKPPGVPQPEKDPVTESPDRMPVVRA